MEEPDEALSAVAANLGHYFDSEGPTIFDEIVSPDKNIAEPLPDPSSIFQETDESKTLFKDDNVPANTPEQPSSVKEIYREAWIPSDNTRKILRDVATSANGNNVERENLTMPGLAYADELPDLTKKAVAHFFGEDEVMHRSILTVTSVTQDERGLRELINAGCYRAAVNLSGRLLAVYGQGFGKIDNPSKHTYHSLQLWFTRLALLTKLRLTVMMDVESKPFGNLDKPDMYFRFYPELFGTRPGSMAPFAFRLLLAEIPLYCGREKEVLDNLFNILAVVNKIIDNLENDLSEEGSAAKYSSTERENSLRLWRGRKSRSLISVVNCAFYLKDYVLATEVLEDLYASKGWTEDQKNNLIAAVSRIHLNMGDVFGAEKLNVAKTERGNEPSTLRCLVDRGLMSVAQNAFQEALNYFKTASTMDPSNLMIANNVAVCLLYTGNLEAAVKAMELALMKNPAKSLQESILLNISTLYELYTTHNKQSKLNLLRQLNRYRGDAVDVQCLKLPI